MAGVESARGATARRSPITRSAWTPAARLSFYLYNTLDDVDAPWTRWPPSLPAGTCVCDGARRRTGCGPTARSWAPTASTSSEQELIYTPAKR